MTSTSAAGTDQHWLPLDSDVRAYVDGSAAGTLPATLKGHHDSPLAYERPHPVLPHRTSDPIPEGSKVLYLAAGCFWGVERIFWKQPGVLAASVGYMGGGNANPRYREVCTGRTGHAETVAVVYDPAVCGTGGEQLLRTFFENHDSTHENRHGNDIGTQYRSAIWVTTVDQARVAHALREAFQAELTARGLGHCYTTIGLAHECFSEEGGPFYLAENYHQAYLFHNPDGYCNHGPNGITCPVGLANLPSQTSVLSADTVPTE